MMHKSGRNDKTTPGASVQDVTLGDYIARKSEPPKKSLTFEEWWQTAGGVDLNHIKQGDQWYGPFIDKATFKLVWNIAQENV